MEYNLSVEDSSSSGDDQMSSKVTLGVKVKPENIGVNSSKISHTAKDSSEHAVPKNDVINRNDLKNDKNTSKTDQVAESRTSKKVRKARTTTTYAELTREELYSALGDEPDLAFLVDDDDKKPAKRRKRKENTKLVKVEENSTNSPTHKNSEANHDGKLEESDDIAEEDPVERTLRLERSLNRTTKWRNKHLKIVVIGAGIAGITAAKYLQQIGYDVTIFEARNRIGGRIHTVTSKELKVGTGIDIGAAFVHGIEGNPITKLLHKLGASIHPTGNDCPLYDSNGVRVNEEQDILSENLFNQFLAATDKMRNRMRHSVVRKFIGKTELPSQEALSKLKEQVPTLEEDMSLGKALNDVMAEFQKKHGAIPSEQWKILNWHFANIEGPCGADVSRLSLKNWDQDDPYEFGGAHCLVKEGYGYVINQLARGLDIRLSSIVQNIDYTKAENNPKNRIVITTANGKFEADFVLVTVPLGVLKTGAITFTPALPPSKQLAIRKLGFGLLNKLVLFFPRVFWDTRKDYVGFISEKRGEFYLFMNMYKVIQAPVLVSMIAGQAALEIEQKNADQLVATAMGHLKKVFGDSCDLTLKIYGNIPNPIRSVVTRWGSDPYALGSFSYTGVGANGDDYEELGKSVSDRVFFAGEATNRYHPSTVSGAYMSGIRAAHEIASVCTDFDEEMEE